MLALCSWKKVNKYLILINFTSRVWVFLQFQMWTVEIAEILALCDYGNWANVYRVPKSYQHRKDENGRFIPLLDGAHYDNDRKEEGATQEEWDKAQRDIYMLIDVPIQKRTHYMMFECTSEGHQLLKHSMSWLGIYWKCEKQFGFNYCNRKAMARYCFW